MQTIEEELTMIQTTPSRVAIITGGGRGIGKAAAVRLTREGQAVVIVYARNHEEANHTVSEITAAGGQALALQADVAEPEAVAAAFNLAASTFGGVDVVVHSAGLLILDTVAALDLEQLDLMHRTNIRGTFVVNQQAARCLRSGGAIINLSTSVTKLALPAYAAYAASKSAVDAISPILAKELRGRDITVNAVAPGPTATELFLAGKEEATIKRMAGMNPMERLGLPDDIAEVIAFLAGPGRWINGQTVYVNGGMV
ncbi:MAG: short-chain dehydrogenase/reductase [Paenibacillaceae bacterium]|jgi:3-oxoacyl-[acyl-carrier protein] reductase|nr:short-chain dehydrogenase/reductase [Paenibacillaceae bacterium]